MTYSQINKTSAVFGLKEEDIEDIIAILQKHAEAEEAIIFGSRAKGNYKNGAMLTLH